jgi:hypothetical protein
VRKKRALPPNSQTVAVEGISGILSKPRHGCGRNSSMVFSVKVN